MGGNIVVFFRFLYGRYGEGFVVFFYLIFSV